MVILTTLVNITVDFFAVSYRHQHYSAGIACQVDQEEAAIFLLSNLLQQLSRVRPCAIKLLHLHTLADRLVVSIYS